MFKSENFIFLETCKKKQTNETMSTIVVYNRYFDKASAKRGEIVEVTFEVSFVAPFNAANVWFDNVGDNLGGSTNGVGPLDSYASGSIAVTNLSPSSVNWHAVGSSSLTQGCFRFWAKGTNYPSSTNPLSNVWKPISPLQPASIKITHKFRVHDSALIGTTIFPPTRQFPTNDNDFSIGKMMIDLGASMNLSISTGSAPGGYSRTLQIVA